MNVGKLISAMILVDGDKKSMNKEVPTLKVSWVTIGKKLV